MSAHSNYAYFNTKEVWAKENVKNGFPYVNNCTSILLFVLYDHDSKYYIHIVVM